MNALFRYFVEAFPGKVTLRVEDVPDMSGKVVVITGGNGGIGRETAKVLLSKNAKVYIASRSRERALEAINKLKEETSKEAFFIELDVSDLKSVRMAVDEIKSKEQKIDILFNNAGVMNSPIGQLTADGYDYQFGTNVIGHFLLTKSLLPLLRAGAQESPSGNARVINMTSSAIHFASQLNLEAMKDVTALRKLGSAQMYLQSKLANLVLSNEISRRYSAEGIVSVAVNPGNITTGIQRYSPKLFTILSSWYFYPVHLGVLTGLYAAVTPDILKVNGKYLIPWGKEGKIPASAKTPGLGTHLWDWLDNETKGTP